MGAARVLEYLSCAVAPFPREQIGMRCVPHGLDARVSSFWLGVGGVLQGGVAGERVGGEVSETKGCFGFIQLREREREMAAERNEGPL